MLLWRTTRIMPCWPVLVFLFILAIVRPVCAQGANTAYVDQETLTIRALISEGRLSTLAIAPLSGLRSKGIDVLGATPTQLGVILREQGHQLSAAEKQALEQVVALTSGTQEASTSTPPIFPAARPPLPPLPPMSLPPALPMVELGSTQYTGLITTAKEATLALMGELSAADEQKFEQHWAAYYDFPSDEIVEHFRAATPILTEFLNIRTNIASTAAEFDQVWDEAHVAFEYGDYDSADALLAQADMLKEYLVALEARGRQLTQALQDLGEAPDPVVAKTEALARHKSATQALLDLFGEDEPLLEGIWYGSVEEDGWLKDLKDWPTLFVVYNVGSAGQPHYRALMLDTDEYDEKKDLYIDILGMYDGDAPWMPGIAHAFEENSINYTCTLEDEEDGERWQKTFRATRLAEDAKSLTYPDSVSLETIEAACEKARQQEDNTAKEDDEGDQETSDYSMDNMAKSIASGVIGAFYEKIISDTIESIRKYYRLTPNFVVTARKWLAERPFSAETTLAQDQKAFSAMLAALIGDSDKPQHSADTALQEERKEEPDAKSMEDELAAAEEASRKERIEFHKQNIIIIQRNLERDRAELDKETDPERRAQLEFRVVCGQSDLQSEKDLISSIETGSIVRTRTAFDDYAMAGLIESAEKSRQERERFRQYSGALFKLAAMLPGEDGNQARAFVERQLTSEVRFNMDYNTVKRIADALGKKVEGYHLGQQAKSDEDAAYATLGLEVAENIKGTADASMMVLSLFGGTSVHASYLATTGYIEGGPTEAVLQSVSALGSTAAAASEALRGYRAGGVEEAFSRGATTWALTKSMQYGAGKVIGKIKSVKAAKTSTTTSGQASTVAKPPAAAEKQALEQFKQARLKGEKLVEDFQKAQEKLFKAGASGASADEITILQNITRHKALHINNNPHAKNFLKYKGDPFSKRAYNAHISGVHAEVEARFHTEMQGRGWNNQPLKEFRNAASAGSVGMDFDIGLDEQAVTALMKNGKRASVAQWQKDATQAWERAYKQQTGFDAGRAWENVTSSAHAESYRDLALLSVNKTGLSKAWAGQSADVTRYKSWHMLNDANLDQMTKLQEVSRGAAKDIQTKLKPILDQIKPTRQSTTKFESARSHWDKICQILADFGENNIDPITADRRVRSLSGGKSIPEVVEDMTYLMESAIKFANRG